MRPSRCIASASLVTVALLTLASRASAAWMPNGTAVTTAPGVQAGPIVVPDGAGGAFFAWNDAPSGDVFVQHLNVAGLPAPGWPAGGRPVAATPAPRSLVGAWSDAHGGVLVAWSSDSAQDFRVTAIRLAASGAPAPGWGPDGSQL